MPTLEAHEYEQFSYDEANQHSLTLDEAVRKAKDLKRNDSTNFYRVVRTDDNGTTFTVTSIPIASVYADFMARVAKAAGRYVVRHAKNK
jgi:hypothetical protein